MHLIDTGRSRTEPLPYLLSELLGHRTALLPLLVQFLELIESLYHIGIVLQRLSPLAKSGLKFQILLEIQIAKLIVYLDQVIEILDIVLISVVHVLYPGLRYRTDLTPSGLKGPELGKYLVDVLRTLKQFLQFLDNLQLLLQIGLLLALQILEIHGAAGFIVGAL